MEMLRTLKKIDVSTLTRDMFEDKYILERYFRHNNRHLTRFHIPELTVEEYEAEIRVYATKSRRPVASANMKYDTATSYYIKKMREERCKRDLAHLYRNLDFSNYIWNEDYYITDNLYVAMDYAESRYLEETDSIYDVTAHDVYIKECAHQKSIDIELFYEMYSFCVTAIRKRKVLLFNKVEQCLSVLKMILEYTDGLNINSSKNMMNTLESYKKFFTELLTDESTANWLAEHSDIDIFANSYTKSDYIDTYTSCVRKLTAINSEATDTVEFVRGLIHNENDPYEDEIIDKLYSQTAEHISYIEDLAE